MKRIYFPYVLICMNLLVLSSCAVNYQHGNMDTVRPNAKYAARNASIGLQFLSQGKINLAEENLQLALRQNPKDPLIIDSMAYFYEKTGQVKKANQHYLYALATNPDSALANQNYAAFLCRNGYYPESVHYFNMAAKLPNNPHAKIASANSHYCQQKMQHALGDQGAWAYDIANSGH